MEEGSNWRGLRFYRIRSFQGKRFRCSKNTVTGGIVGGITGGILAGAAYGIQKEEFINWKPGEKRKGVVDFGHKRVKNIMMSF